MAETVKYKYVVAVRCVTYNHAAYIDEALKGFAIQKVNFPVIYIIIDDASTDGEQSVLKRWASNNLEKNEDTPLWENRGFGQIALAPLKSNKMLTFAILLLSENHYQKGKSKLIYMTEWLKSSKYQAVCEGDDYWIVPDKLQRQFDLMENNPNVDMCAHNTYILNEKKYVGKLGPSEKDTLLITEDVINGGGSYLSTNSLFARSEVFNTPQRFYQYMMLDYTLQIAGSLRGGILFMSDYMSVYRQYSSGSSWTSVMHKNPTRLIEHREKVIRALEMLDEDTESHYSKAIKTQIRCLRFMTALDYYDMDFIYSEENRNLYNNLSVKKKLELRIYTISPKLIQFVRKIMKK